MQQNCVWHIFCVHPVFSPSARCCMSVTSCNFSYQSKNEQNSSKLKSIFIKKKILPDIFYFCFLSQKTHFCGFLQSKIFFSFCIFSLSMFVIRDRKEEKREKWKCKFYEFFSSHFSFTAIGYRSVLVRYKNLQVVQNYSKRMSMNYEAQPRSYFSWKSRKVRPSARNLCHQHHK